MLPRMITKLYGIVANELVFMLSSFNLFSDTAERELRVKTTQQQVQLHIEEDHPSVVDGYHASHHLCSGLQQTYSYPLC